MLTLLTVSEQQRHSMLSLQCILGKMNFQRIAAVLASRTPRKKNVSQERHRLPDARLISNKPS